jgi:3D (Asp-Asp-Asp) domain-containing protein
MSRPTEKHNRLTLFDARRTPFLIAGAVRASRPSTRLAVLAAAMFIACCFARSDARIETDPSHTFDTSHIVGSWYSGTLPHASRLALDDARARAVISSAQAMLSTPHYDDALGVAAHVAPLRVDTVMQSRRIAIPVLPNVRISAHLSPGVRTVVRKGSPDIAWVTERVTYWNDVVVDRQVISREIVRRGTPAQVVEGTPKTLAQLRSDNRYRVALAMTMVATAYTADTATAYPTGYTATGILAHQGVVAVDPRVIPLGSTVFVPGYGIAIAADTGGAIIGNRIDLCMDSYGDAINFGRQTVQVYLLKR